MYAEQSYPSMSVAVPSRSVQSWLSRREVASGCGMSLVVCWDSDSGIGGGDGESGGGADSDEVVARGMGLSSSRR